jgi:integrase
MGISGRSLRRGMATELSHRGVSEAERMEVLGHADRRTAARYVDQRVLG